MAKKKRKRRRRKKARKGNDFRDVQIIEYEITSEPIAESQYDRLPHHVKDAIKRLHDEAQKNPQEVIPELLDLVEKYPNVPILYNYLSVAYSQSGQPEKAKEVVRENYRRNPDYLFARLNYAELYRASGDYDKIAEIFDHKFDLKLLYPKRKRFHVSEVAGFMGLMGIYFFETGERELSETYYEFLRQLVPEYPMTKLLKQKLHPGPIRRLLHRLADSN